MKYLIIFSICFCLGCFAIQQAKTGLDTVKQAKTAQNQIVAMLDK
jgi:hypothetical protein